MFVILSGNLNADLQVLSKVGGQHGFQTFQTVVNAERTEVFNQPFRFEQVGVDDSSLDIEDVSVMLKSALKELSLFAKLGDVSSIVVSEHLVTENSIRHLGSENIITDQANPN